MHNPRTEALVKAASRIIDPQMYELASELEDTLHRVAGTVTQNYCMHKEIEALRNQLALERKHLTASGRYTNT